MLRLNSAGRTGDEPYRETENGVNWLVVPNSIVAREMVYSYSDRPEANDSEFLPANEIEQAARRFNDKHLPVTLNHPIVATPTGLQPGSVGDKNVVNPGVVGDFRNVRSNGGKMIGDVWLNLDKRGDANLENRNYSDIIDQVEDGEGIPVSPGYLPQEIEQKRGRHNGDKYQAIQRDIYGDHVALIVDENATARCTPEDGCVVGGSTVPVTANASGSEASGWTTTGVVRANAPLQVSEDDVPESFDRVRVHTNASGSSEAKTEADDSEKKSGSDKNDEGSASDGADVDFSDSIINGLEGKIEDQKDKLESQKGDDYADWRVPNLRTLKAVFRRGAGAFSSTHRPGMTRNGWAYARVSAFLYFLRNDEPENENYDGPDNDLLPSEHPKSSK